MFEVNTLGKVTLANNWPEIISPTQTINKLFLKFMINIYSWLSIFSHYQHFTFSVILFTVRHIIYIYISIFLEIIISEQSYTTSSIIAPFQLERYATRVVLVPIKTPIKDSPSRKIDLRFQPQ